jgi:apolipoprotein N-acyltransferase
VLEAKVPLITHRTWADDAGAWPEWVIVGLTALALLAAVASLSGYRRAPRRVS